MVYNPLNGRYALLNEGGVCLLKEAIEKSVDDSIPKDFNELAVFLGEKGEKSPEKKGPVNPKFLGIIPSRRCNMVCAYCDFGAHENHNAKLDPGLLVTAIDWFADLRVKSKQKGLEIQFFGGEPFVERELLDIAIHHARFLGARTGLVPQFEALSNGFYDEKQRIFIKDYFDRIVISLDGFKTFQDINRSAPKQKSTFNKVVQTLHYLSDQNIDLSIRCCVTSESVFEMEAIADWFCKDFKPENVNFESLTENEFTKKEGLLPPDPYDFAINTVRSWSVLKRNGVEPANAAVSLNEPQTTSCPVGRDVVIVHPDGMLASCYVQETDWTSKGMDLSLGKVENKNIALNTDKLLSLRNQLDEKPRCSSCFCRFGCAGGCHVNNTWPGSSPDYQNYCIYTRIITLTSLLEEMGESELVLDLLNDKTSMVKIARQKTDKLSDFTTRS